MNLEVLVNVPLVIVYMWEIYGKKKSNTKLTATSNIYKIAETSINKLERLSYLCREISNQSV